MYNLSDLKTTTTNSIYFLEISFPGRDIGKQFIYNPFLLPDIIRKKGGGAQGAP